jgi:hypothetical protein
MWFFKKKRVTALYMAPLSIYTYDSLSATSAAVELLPVEEYPSIAMMIFCMGCKILNNHRPDMESAYLF